MKLRLSDIPREGARFAFKAGDEQELDQALQDLIGHQPYEVQFVLRPLDQSGTFDIKGTLSARWEEGCSHCAEPFLFQFQTDFHEILLPKSEMPRNGSSNKPHHVELHGESEFSEAFEYSHDHFDLGEFIHELIALARPVAPKPPITPSGLCSHCGLDPKTISLRTHSSPLGKNFDSGHPFSVLKKLRQ